MDLLWIFWNAFVFLSWSTRFFTMTRRQSRGSMLYPWTSLTLHKSLCPLFSVLHHAIVLKCKGKSENNGLPFNALSIQLQYNQRSGLYIAWSAPTASHSPSSSQDSGTQQHSPILQTKVSASQSKNTSDKEEESCSNVYTRRAQL